MNGAEEGKRHLFDRIYGENGIEHRLIKPNHPGSDEDQKTVWGTVCPRNGQVERMNRTIKNATAKRFYYASHMTSLGGTFSCSSTPITMPGG